MTARALPFAAVLTVVAASPAAAGLGPDPGAPAVPSVAAAGAARGMPAGRVPLRGVFRRGDGTLHLRLDASRSVPVKLDRASGIWIPRGVARPLDPHETVRLIEE